MKIITKNAKTFIETERWNKLVFLPTKDIKKVKEWLATNGVVKVFKS